MPGAKGSIHKTEHDEESARELYSHDDYVDLVLDSGRPLTHEYEGGSIEEDPRMLAFFDTLIQREHGGWNSESDSNYSEDDFYSSYLVRSSDGSESDSERVSVQRVRELLSQENRDSDESEDTSLAVLRRVRRLRRAAFLRRLVRGAERQVEGGDEGEQHPSDSQNAFLRHLTREIMREALETSSESSDSEPTITLALPEDLHSDNNEDNEPVQFNRSRARHTRQYRRRSSSEESSPSSSVENINNTEIDTPVRPSCNPNPNPNPNCNPNRNPNPNPNPNSNTLVRNNRRRRESSSSSSEEDTHEDEFRASYLHAKRTKRRKKLDESDSEQTNGGASNNNIINEPSTSSENVFSPSLENQTLERHLVSSFDSSTCTNESQLPESCTHLNEEISNYRHSSETSNVFATLDQESTVVQDLHENTVNHNGHKGDLHNNHNSKTHYP